MRRAALYDLGTSLFVHAYALTEAGFWIASDPAATLRSESSDEEVGMALQSSLSRDFPVQPTSSRRDYLDIGDPIWKSAGLSSWTELQRRARMCDLELLLDKVRLIPMRNERRGGERAFYHDEEQSVEVNPSDAKTLGAAARSALARAVLL
jgi:hypothetical protein